MLLDLFWICVVLLLGYAVGSIQEKRHFSSIRARERDLIGRALVVNTKGLPELTGHPQFRLVAGSTVVSVDAFKRLAAWLHSLFGAPLSAYESLLDRARREALLRMREKADNLGAPMIFGVRLETSPINDGNPQSSVGVEITAYGTAVIPDTVSAGAKPFGGPDSALESARL